LLLGNKFQINNIIKKKHKIQLLIDQGESQHLDFKFEVSDAAKIARTLVAFANTKGGKLLIGVKDNGKISGIRSEEEYYMLENAATRYCEPEINFSSKEWNLDGKKVLEISIPQSHIIPHRAPDHNDKMKAYIRIDDQNILANGIQMKIWQKGNTNKEIKFVYSNEAKKLLDLFNIHKYLSLKQIIDEINLSRYKTENLLAELIIMKVILMDVGEHTSLFRINETLENDY